MNEVFVPDQEIEEVNIVTAEGRVAFMNEVENLALTSSFAADVAQFEASSVYKLVTHIQTLLHELEHELESGGDGAHIAMAIQTVYDQLAEEVLVEPVIAFYTGELDLASIDEQGAVSIQDATKKAERTKRTQTSKHIHNRLSEQSSSVSQNHGAGQNIFAPKNLHNSIERRVFEIESQQLDFLDRTFSSYISPCVALADAPFTDVKEQALAPAGSRQYFAFRSLLEELGVKYDVFIFWSQQFSDIEQVVIDFDQKTFKEVIFEYVKKTTE